jgi:hypothetical protein
VPDPANATAISSFTGFPALHAGAASGWVAVFKVDLDEAVHGLYGTARTAMEALLKGRSEILQSWADDGYQLGYRTIEWLRAQETPSVFGVAVAAVTLPLAVLAVIGGIGEINEGGDALRRLRAEEKCLLAAAAAAVAPRVTAEVERGAEPGKGEAVANVEAKVEPDASGDADGEASDFRLAIDARYRKSRLAQIGREKAVAVADVQVGAASTGAGVLFAVAKPWTVRPTGRNRQPPRRRMWDSCARNWKSARASWSGFVTGMSPSCPARCYTAEPRSRKLP